MKEVKFLKSPVWLLAVLVTAVGVFFFSSATSVDHADSEAIRALSDEMAKAETEIMALQTLNDEGAVWSEPTLGQVAMFAGNFEPRGWVYCDGRLLPISQYNALFSLLGTYYGGDGRTTFALPDLRGRVPVHQGQGPGLHNHHLGSRFGVESTDIKTSKLPAASSSGRDQVQVLGGVHEHVDIRQPGLGINYIIALTGNFPSRG